MGAVGWSRLHDVWGGLLLHVFRGSPIYPLPKMRNNDSASWAASITKDRKDMFNLQVKISKRYLLKDVNWVRNMRILKGDVELPLTPVWSEEITSKHGGEICQGNKRLQKGAR